MSGRTAVFLDRDGTVVEDPGYLGDPARVRLIPGAADAIARLNRAGRMVVLVTNQSGIGRGLYGEEDFRAVQRRIEELLARDGAKLDAVYHCPHSPDTSPACECRKPAPGLFLRAAEEHGIDLTRSVFVGDRVRDIAPAAQWGARGIMVGEHPGETPPSGMVREPDLTAAVERILAGSGS